MASPPSTPRQSVPPLSLEGGADPSTRLFTKVWWLFVKALGDLMAKLAQDRGYYVVPVVAAGSGWTATPDLSKGLHQEVILAQASVAIQAPVSASVGDEWTLVVVQDAAGGRLITLASSFAGAAALPGMLNTTAGTYSSLFFVIRPDNHSALQAITTGMPLT
jgi:hypothetical protein